MSLKTSAVIIAIVFFNPIISSGQSSIIQSDGNTLSVSPNIFNPTLTKNSSSSNDYIEIYQKYISGIRGHECPMFPSCSNYGLKVFSERSFIDAFLLTSDRLLRCGHDHNNYQLTLQENGFKFIDYPHYDEPPKPLYYKRNEYYFSFSDNKSDDSSSNYYKSFLNNGYYQLALYEILKQELRQDTFDIELFINKIICLRSIQEFEKALFEYETRCPSNFKNNHELLYQVALVNYKLSNFENADLLIKTASLNYVNCYENKRLNKFKILILANQGDWNNALKYANDLSALECNDPNSKQLQDVCRLAIKNKKKSPFAAATLSIVPGLGYWYTGNGQTGISSFIINGLLAYGTYTSIKSNNIGIAALTGLFSFSFYIGNIYGSAKSAKRVNINNQRKNINKIEYNINL